MNDKAIEAAWNAMLSGMSETRDSYNLLLKAIAAYEKVKAEMIQQHINTFYESGGRILPTPPTSEAEDE